MCMAHVGDGHPLLTPGLHDRFRPRLHISCHALAFRAAMVQLLVSPNNAGLPSRHAFQSVFRLARTPLDPSASSLHIIRLGNWMSPVCSRNPAKRRARLRVDLSRLSHFVLVLAFEYDSTRCGSFSGDLMRAAGSGAVWVNSFLQRSTFGPHIWHPYSIVSSNSALVIPTLICSDLLRRSWTPCYFAEAFAGVMNTALEFNHKLSMLGNI